MATAQSILESALRKLGVLGVGESITDADELADGIESFNQLLDSLGAVKSLAYAEQTIEHAITAGLATITIAASGATWTATRPIRISGAQWIESDYATPMSIDVPLAEFKRLSSVESTGLPTILNYEAAFPLGILSWYPTPTNNGTLQLVTQIPLPTAVSASTSISLPPGYELMLVYDLAIILAPDYERTLSESFMAVAREVRATAKRPNTKTPLLRTMPGLPGRAPRSNILRGDE